MQGLCGKYFDRRIDCGGGSVEDGSAVGAGSQMFEELRAFVVEQRAFRKSGEGVGVRVREVRTRSGSLTLGQLSADRVGGDFLQEADPFLL